MYSKLENLAKEFIISDCTREVHIWYHRQTIALRGVQGSFDWLVKQCSGGYWEHMQKTLLMLERTAHFPRWGIHTEFPAGVLVDEGIDAYAEQQDEFAGFVGDMLLGVFWSRCCWGLDFLFGWPKRGVLFASEHGVAAAAQFQDHWEAHEKMMASDSIVCQQKALRSHMLQTPSMQMYHLLRRTDWVPTDPLVNHARKMFGRIMSTKMIEEAHRSQNSFVRRNPVRTVAHNTAFYALDHSCLLQKHKFSPDSSVGPDGIYDERMAMDNFEPSEHRSWQPLRQLPSWSPTTKWWTPGPEDIHDSIGDLLCCMQLDDLESMPAVQTYTALLRGHRMVIQNKEDNNWYLVTGVVSDCFPVCVPLQRHAPTFNDSYFTLLAPEHASELPRLVIDNPRNWLASTFVWASPLRQLVGCPSGALLRSTQKRIVMLLTGRLEDLHLYAARCAFWDLSQSAVFAVASRLDMAVPRNVDFFEYLFALVKMILKCDDEEVLRVLQQRTRNRKKHEGSSSSRQLKHFEDLKDVLTQDETKAHKDLKHNSEAGDIAAKSFKDKWSVRRNAFREQKKKAHEEAAAKAAPVPPAKKKSKSGAAVAIAVPAPPLPLDPIDQVRSRARAALPVGTVEQGQLRSMLPPGCSIWNNWRGEAWCAHLSGHTRDSEPWVEHGRDGAAYTLLARLWRQWLKDQDMPDTECPISGLLASW